MSGEKNCGSKQFHKKVPKEELSEKAKHNPSLNP